MPSLGAWRIRSDATEQGFFAKLRWETEYCYELSGAPCPVEPGGPGEANRVRFRLGRMTALAVEPWAGCRIITQRSDVAEPGCQVIRPGSAEFLQQYPDSALHLESWPTLPIRYQHPGLSDFSRVGAIVSRLLDEHAGRGTDSLQDYGLVPGSYVVTDEGCLVNGVWTPCYTVTDDRMKFVPEAQGTLDSHRKFVMGHELGHLVQAHAMGTLSVNYWWGSSGVDDHPGAPELCRCDHVDTFSRAHCLQSLEKPGPAQLEGFASFYAAKLWNDATQADCTFVYNKEFLDTECHNTVDQGACVPASVPGLQVTRPPVVLSCSAPTRWRNTHCATTAVGPDEALATFSTELDWMTFFWNLNTQGPYRLTVSEIFSIYYHLCGDQRYDRANPTYDQLAEAWKALLPDGEASPRYRHLRDRAFEAGVSTDMTPGEVGP